FICRVSSRSLSQHSCHHLVLPAFPTRRSSDLLDDSELAALFGLVILRLCTSVCIAADQQRQRPDNAYLGVSQSGRCRCWSAAMQDRKSTRLNSSHQIISYAVFCLQKKKIKYRI